MIDILFIVLIFLIVSTTFKKPRTILPIELPTVRDIASTEVIDDRSVLTVDKEGRMTLDTLAVPDVVLLDAYLKAFLKENPGRKLELEADKEIPLEKLLEVWDALTRAGIPIKDVPARIRLPE
jgi:biopolymer transport protein ExbD